MQQRARQPPAALALALLALGACRASAVSGDLESLRSSQVEHAAIRRMLDQLYSAFCFDPGSEADWERMRALFAPGASFFPPATKGVSPRGTGQDPFLEEFRRWITQTQVGSTGLHEAIVNAKLEVFGGIAHAWVTFDAFVPGSPPDRRGIDSLQLVLDGDTWKVASFTTQYAGDSLPVPERLGS